MVDMLDRQDRQDWLCSKDRQDKHGTHAGKTG